MFHVYSEVTDRNWFVLAKSKKQARVRVFECDIGEPFEDISAATVPNCVVEVENPGVRISMY